MKRPRLLVIVVGIRIFRPSRGFPLSDKFSWTRYARGRWREYRVAEALLERGYWVFRSIKSLGPADLFVLKPDGVRWLVQVKMRKQPNRAEPKNYELEKLVALGATIDIRPMFVGNDEHGRLLFWEWDLLGKEWREVIP